MTTYRAERAFFLMAAVVGSGLVASALAADRGEDVARGKAIALQGNASGLPACGGCHGDAGEGQAGGGIPRLAGLPAAYLKHQLGSFRDGSRADAVMVPLAGMMDAESMTDVAAYYAQLPPPASKPRSGDDAKTVSLGETLALHGDWSRTLPACASCHGLRGLGVGDAFPPLAGQSAAYITAQLQEWREGTRRNDPQGLMRDVASRLDEARIAAVAAYYATLPTEGASR